MTDYSIEITGREDDKIFGFDAPALADEITRAVTEKEHCPYDPLTEMIITDDDGIKEINREQRGIDKPTDVLSFPNLQFETPGDFSYVDECPSDCFDPESGLLFLGTIIINADAVERQAEAYGHGVKREFAFLTAHSLFHLCGYDHETPEEEKEMFTRQEEVLDLLGITRDM